MVLLSEKGENDERCSDVTHPGGKDLYSHSGESDTHTHIYLHNGVYGSVCLGFSCTLIQYHQLYVNLHHALYAVGVTHSVNWL